MRIKTTHRRIGRALIREVVNAVKPSGISNFSIWVKNSSGSFAGCAYGRYVVIRIGNKNKYPFKQRYVDRSESFPEIEYKNEEELLVGLIAHELRHVWQSKMRNKRGYYKGSKGRFSEYDAEMYAQDMIAKWRRMKDGQAETGVVLGEA